MNIICLLCFTCLRIVHAYDGKNCYLIDLSMFDQFNYTHTYQKILSAHTQQCTHAHASKSKGSVQMTCDIGSKCSVTFERISRHNKFKYEKTRLQCKGAGKPVGITCPLYTAVNTENASKNSFICTILIKTDDKQKENVSLPCKVVKPVNDRTTESHVVKPVNDRTTESHGIPDYVFILGGIAGVLIITCIIVAVFLLRKNNCSEFRNTQMTSNDQIMPTVNPTFTTTGRPSNHENHHQANFVNAPKGSNLSTTHAVYFDNRTDDKAIKLCSLQQPGIQANKHEANIYSHLRTTTDDSDDMYDHTVRNAVRNTCDGDYGVAHIRITEDDYNVSGNYHHPLTKKEDPVYT